MDKDIERNYTGSELQNDSDTVLCRQGKGNYSEVPGGGAVRWKIGANWGIFDS
jgi:hypothetical protein